MIIQGTVKRIYYQHFFWKMLKEITLVLKLTFNPRKAKNQLRS